MSSSDSEGIIEQTKSNDDTPNVSEQDSNAQNKEIENIDTSYNVNDESEYKKQIEELNKRIEDKEVYINQQRSEYQKLQHQVSKIEEEKPIEKKPILDDFVTDEEYYSALVKWELNNSTSKFIKKAVKEQLSVEKQQKEFEKRTTEFIKKVEVFKKENPDFDDVATTPMLRNFYKTNPTIAAMIEDLPNAPEVAYYLGKNTDIVFGLKDLNTTSLFSKLLNLNNKFLDKKSKKSQAPDPINAIKSSNDSVFMSNDEMSYTEWKRNREKNIRK